jgi:hypothetical protein
VAALGKLVVQPVDPRESAGWAGRIRILLSHALKQVLILNTPLSVPLMRLLVDLHARARDLARPATISSERLAEIEWLRGDLMTCIRSMASRDANGVIA